ncbi:MAG: PKD domain-containing protein, partial [Candidatus Thermoplasmatota archaeon]
IDNGINAFDDGANIWNKSIGNYWSNYTGKDENMDGIADEPYIIDENSIDYFPLIKEAGKPICKFNFTPMLPYSFEEVSFIDASFDFDGNITSWLWSFGDGNYSNEKNSKHKYSKRGIYKVKLVVFDNEGKNDSMEKYIEVLNLPPFADFDWQPATPTDLDNVTFDASLSYDLDGRIVNYTWQFGDGSIAYEINASHRYADNGTYNVTLTIIDDDGAEANITKSINVLNVAPFANFYSIDNVTILDIVYFYSDKTNYASFDPDGIIVNYTWSFGDGSISYEKNPSHQYKNKGVYKVTLTITDNDGAKSNISKSITVINLPPFADFEFSPLNPTDLDNIIFNANKSYDLDGSIVNYTWQFGDGSIGYGINASHRYADNGTYLVVLTVEDNDGKTSTKEKIIEVANIPPVAIFSAPQEAREKEEVNFDASMSYDRDGTIVSYSWDFDGDGIIDAYGKIVKYRYEKRGAYTVKLSVIDNDGANSTFYGFINIREKEKIPGFELAIIIAASAILIFMRKYRLGIWRI